MAKAAKRKGKDNRKKDSKPAKVPAKVVSKAAKPAAKPLKPVKAPAKAAKPAAKPTAKPVKAVKGPAKAKAKAAAKAPTKGQPAKAAKPASKAKPAAKPLKTVVPAKPAPATTTPKTPTKPPVTAPTKVPPAKAAKPAPARVAAATKAGAPARVEPPQAEVRKLEPKKASVVKLQPVKQINPLEPPANPNTLIHGQKPYIAQAGEQYMSDGQLAHFRRILHAWKQELMEEVDRTVHHMQDESANLPDPNDRATQEEEFALELRTRDRERKLIKKIDKTLTIIEDGDYGYCQACGIEIGIRRLEARPTAELCIDCKTLAEIKEKQVGSGG